MGNDAWEGKKISFVQTIFWHLKVQAARENFILTVEKCLWSKNRGKILCRMPESRQGLSPQQLQQWQESSSTWVKLENRFLAAFVWLCDECLFKGSLKNMTLKSFKHTTVFLFFPKPFNLAWGFVSCGGHSFRYPSQTLFGLGVSSETCYLHSLSEVYLIRSNKVNM